MDATIARTSTTVGQGGISNLQGFQAHHPPTYMGGGDLMVRKALAIEKEVDDTQSIRDMGASAKKKEINLLLALGRSKRLLFRTDFRDEAAAISVKA